MTGGYTLDAATINAIAADLDSVKGSLSGQEATARVTPDAGASSTEVSQAYAGFATALSALADSVGGVAQSVRDSVDAYQRSDDRSAGGFGGPR